MDTKPTPSNPQPGQHIPPVQAGANNSQPVGSAAPNVSPTPAHKVNPNSTQNMLHIAEIRDGIVIMNDGSYRAVIMAQSINFDLMSPEEREAVEFAYQGFLNSLYFPIQIFIRSQKIDMRPYLERLNKLRTAQENMLLGMLMEDYIVFIANLVTQTNIMDKKFYIVVPYYPSIDITKPVEASKKVIGNFAELFKINKTPTEIITVNEADLEKAKQELRNRVQSIINGLNQVGVNGIPLDTQELIELYYDVYNPDTATRQTLTKFSDLTAPIVSKGEGQAPNNNQGGIY